MGNVLLALLIFFVTVMLIIGVVIGLITWRLDRKNRVDPTTSSPAPLSWLVSPSPSAMLHRRLRAAAHLATASLTATTTGPGSLDDVRARIVEQARELDRLVVITARAPRRVRRDHVRSLRPQVTELETLSGRLMGLNQRSLGARPAGTPVDPPAVAINQISERIEMLEHAEAELTNLERANGLADPEAVIRAGRPPPARPADAARPSLARPADADWPPEVRPKTHAARARQQPQPKPQPRPSSS
jgi:hypothetical protein